VNQISWILRISYALPYASTWFGPYKEYDSYLRRYIRQSTCQGMCRGHLLKQRTPNRHRKKAMNRQVHQGLSQRDYTLHLTMGQYSMTQHPNQISAQEHRLTMINRIVRQYCIVFWDKILTSNSCDSDM
jgi:hypothetical protein